MSHVCPHCRTIYDAVARTGAADIAGCPNCGKSVAQASPSVRPRKSTIPVAEPYAPPIPLGLPHKGAKPEKRSQRKKASTPGWRGPLAIFSLLLLVCSAAGLGAHVLLKTREPNAVAVTPSPKGQPESATTSTESIPESAEQPAQSNPAKKPRALVRPILPNEAPPDFQVPSATQISAVSGVDRAMARGVAFLKSQQQSPGTWEEGAHAVGYAALPGLALLVSKVPPNDPSVQRAAFYVRQAWPQLTNTYDLALAVLFLDRLGESRDRVAIQAMALRLAASQTSSGGWAYTAPLLSVPEMNALTNYLNNESRPDLLPISLRSVPAVLNYGRSSGQEILRPGPGDNSNSQFALLALWVARRHGIKSDKVLSIAAQRYRVSQNADGGWGYQLSDASSPAMTCVGLLGFALGHQAPAAPGSQSLVDSRDVQRALAKLGSHLGNPTKNASPLPMGNLYLFWSVERVGMLYDLKTIGGKDWYGYGSQILIQHQQFDGHWDSATFPGSAPPIDTSLALLFLSRVNLVSDLSQSLKLITGIRPE